MELDFVRELEVLDGPILSEYRGTRGGGLYLEKWCTRADGVTRWLLVRTEQRAVAEYLGGRLSMLELLTVASDGVGFLVDVTPQGVFAVFIVTLGALPPEYLPRPNAKHDEALRPEWDTYPQSFLLSSNWSASQLAGIERDYLNAAAFAYFTHQNGAPKALPRSILGYTYDRGYPVASAFRVVRMSMPREMRPRSSGVAAASPGVMTIEAPPALAETVTNALRAISASVKAYEAVYVWSRIKPKDAAEEMPEPQTALLDIKNLAGRLLVDHRCFFPDGADDDISRILVAGKLLAAYWRLLKRLVSRKDGAEFVGVRIDTTASAADVDDFDVEDDIEASEVKVS